MTFACNTNPETMKSVGLFKFNLKTAQEPATRPRPKMILFESQLNQKSEKVSAFSKGPQKVFVLKFPERLKILIDVLSNSMYQSVDLSSLISGIILTKEADRTLKNTLERLSSENGALIWYIVPFWTKRCVSLTSLYDSLGLSEPLSTQNSVHCKWDDKNTESVGTTKTGCERALGFMDESLDARNIRPFVLVITAR
jgi:hypothetical protein